MRLRGVNRYCTGCGSRMRRQMDRVGGWHFDAHTGKSDPEVWWWACSEDRADGGAYCEHSRSRRIKESGARRNLRALEGAKS